MSVMVRRKESADEHKLVVEEETAGIVREIFSLAISGKNANKIARLLNERKVPTRLQNQWKRGVRYAPVNNKGDYLWNNTAVLAILTNEQYAGVFMQNKQECVGFGEYKQLKKCDRAEWSIVQGGCPAIISRETFEKANSMRLRKKSPSGKNSKEKNLFTCPYCRRKLRHSGTVSAKFVCPKWNMLENSDCGKIFMLIETVRKMVVDAVNDEAALRLEILENENKGNHPAENTKKQIAELSVEYERIEESNVSQYTKYRTGVYPNRY